MYRVIEELAKADGSAGWALLIGVTGGFFAGYFNERLAAEIYSADPDAVLAGSLNPRGRATDVEGGYRVSGRWPFASGIEHASWVVGACLIVDADGTPLPGPDGQPQSRGLVLPWEEVTVHDTWSVGGLHGTGSHDLSVSDLFVPVHRSFTVADAPRFPSPLSAARPLAPALMAAVPLGIARGAVDALRTLAGTTTPASSNDLLRERAIVQLHLAQAEAIVRAARAGVLKAAGEVWATILGEGTVPPEQTVLMLRSFPPQYVLHGTGVKPSTMSVRLMPLVYMQQLEYWEIEVVGAFTSDGPFAKTPYTIPLPLSGAMGTKGIQVINANRSDRFDIADAPAPNEQ